MQPNKNKNAFYVEKKEGPQTYQKIKAKKDKTYVGINKHLFCNEKQPPLRDIPGTRTHGCEADHSAQVRGGRTPISGHWSRIRPLTQPRRGLGGESGTRANGKDFWKYFS